MRYVIWELFILAILSSALLAEFGNKWLDRPTKPGVPVVNYVLGGVFVLLAMLLLPGIRSTYWESESAPPVYSETPVEAAEWIASHPELPGPLWADLAFSSYFVHALPERPVWIDTRFEVYPVEQWQAFKAIDSAAWNWQSLLDKTGAKLLVISRASQPDLLFALEKSPVWCEAYGDSLAVVFTRCGVK